MTDLDRLEKQLKEDLKSSRINASSEEEELARLQAELEADPGFRKPVVKKKPAAVQEAEESGGLSNFISSWYNRAVEGWQGESLEDVKAEQYGANEGRVETRRHAANRALGFGYAAPDTEEQLEAVKKAREDERAANAPALAAERKTLEAQVREAGQKAEAAEAQLPAPVSYVSRATGRVAGQPSMVLPVVGGIAGSALAGPAGGATGAMIGSTPMAKDAREAAFVEAKEQFDATDDEAKAYADVIMGIEMGTETLGGAFSGALTTGAKALGLTQFTKQAAKNALARTVRGRLARMTGVGAAEFGEEAVAELGGDATREVMEQGEMLSTPESRSKLAKYNATMATTRLTRVLDAGGAGFFGGTIISAPAVHLAVSAEEGAELARGQAAAREGLAGALLSRQKRETEAERAGLKTEIEAQMDADFAAQEAAKEKSKQEAQAEIDRRKAVEEQRKADEEEAGFRNMQLQREAPNTAMGNALRKDFEWTPEMVAREREEGQKAIDAHQAAQDESVRRLKEDMDRMDAEEAAKAEAAKAKEAAKTKPAPTPVQPKAPEAPAKPAPTPAAAVEEEKEEETTDADVRAAARAAGINVPDVNPDLQRTGEKPKATTQEGEEFDLDQYDNDVRDVITSLIRVRDQESTDVRSLINQGKLVLAPSAASVGHTNEGEALYKTDEGKMYIYLDKLSDKKNAVPAIVAAVHESTHAGQKNKREGRGEAVGKLMTIGHPEVTRLIQQGRGKNAIADKALEQTEAGMAAYEEQYPNMSEETKERLYNTELTAYFADAATQARTKGRYGNLLKRMVADVRSGMRAVGIDMPVSLNDLAQASRHVAGEIVRTELKGEQGQQDLEMVGGKRGKGFKEADAKALSYRGRVDNKLRYVFSDKDAELRSGDVLDALDDGVKVPLSDVIKHDRFAEEYPRLWDRLTVRVDRNYQGTEAGADVEAGTISISPEALQNWNDPDIRNTILHEMQHMVQYEEGHIFGANVSQLMNPRFRSELDKANRDYDKAIDGVLDGTVTEEELADARAKQNAAANAYNTERERAFDLYTRDYGEAEARATEHTSRMSQEELDEVPFEVNFSEARHNVPASRTIESDKYLRGKLEEEAMPARKSEVDDSFLGRRRTRLAEEARRKDDEAAERRAQKRTEEEASRPKTTDEAIERLLDEQGITDPMERRRARIFHEKLQADVEAAGGTGINPQGFQFAESASPKFIEWENVVHQGQIAQITRLHRWPGGTKWTYQLVGPNGLVDNVEESELSAVGPRDLSRDEGPTDLSRAPKPKLSESETVRRVVEHGSRVRTADLKQAEDLDSKYKKAMKLDKLDSTNPQVQLRIKNLLTDIDNTQGPGRTAKWQRFKQKYPNLSKVLEDMRNKMDAQATEFIQSKLNSGKQLNKQEIQEVMEVIAGMNTFLPRAFSALQPQVGGSWAARRYKDYTNTQPATGLRTRLLNAMDRLSRRGKPVVADNIQAVADGIKFFNDRFVIPADAVLATLPSKELVRMWEDHIGPIRTLRHNGTQQDKRAQLINGLARQRSLVSPEEMNAMAENAVREFLGLSEEADSTATVKAYKKAFRESGKLGQAQQALPDELAKLLGEVQDPAGRVLVTLAKQSALLARAKMLGELYQDYQGELVIPKTDRFKPGNDKKFPVALNGEQYGPLDGFYATQALADKLKASHQVNTMFDDIMNNVFMVTQQLTRKEKLAGIVVDPVNWAANFSGSGIVHLMNGNTNWRAAGKGFKTAFDYIYGTAADSTTELLDDAQRYLGIEAVEAQEIQHILGNKLKQYLDGKLDDATIMRTLLAPENTKVGRTTIAGYAMSDAWAKISNFHDRIDTLKRYYDALGETKTIEEIKREAGADASFTNFSAERVPKFLTAGDRRGLTKFAAYFTESFRTPIANMIQAKIDIQRARDTRKLGGPKAEAAANVLMVSAVKRITGATLATAVMPAQLALRFNKIAAIFGLGAAFMLNGEDDDDRSKRLMVSEFNRQGDLIFVGNDVNTGKPVFYNASARLDPIGPSTDLIRDIHTAENPGQAGDAIIQDIKDLVISAQWMQRTWKAFTAPTVPESEIAATFPAAADEFRNSVEAGGFDTSVANKAMYIAGPFLPGMVKAWNPKNVPQVADGNMAKFMAHMGADFETLDPNKAMQQYGFAADEAYTDARKKFTNSITSYAKLSDDNIKEAFVRYAGEYTVQQALDRDYLRSLRNWQYDDEAIMGFFKNNNWSKEQAKKLVEGDRTIPLPIKSVEQTVGRLKIGKIEKKQQELDAREEQLKAWIETHAKELEAMGYEVE